MLVSSAIALNGVEVNKYREQILLLLRFGDHLPFNLVRDGFSSSIEG